VGTYLGIHIAVVHVYAHGLISIKLDFYPEQTLARPAAGGREHDVSCLLRFRVVDGQHDGPVYRILKVTEHKVYP
jgi:hypothetical protein